MFILFLNGFGGRSGVSTSVLAVASYLAEAYQRKSVVFSMQPEWNCMEGYVLGKKKKLCREQMFSEIGLEGLRKLLKSGLEEGRSAGNCAFSCNEMLDLLPGYYPSEKGRMITEYLEILPRFLRYLKEYYEFIFCDASGAPEELGMQLKKQADGVVVCMNQNAEGINHYFQLKEPGGLPEYYLLGCYDHNSRYNLNNLRYLFMELNRKNSAVIPYCTEVQDACADGELLEIISKARNPEASLPLKYFFTELQNASEGLIRFMERSGVTV